MSLASLTIADITCFLGWCSLINLIIIALTTVTVLCFRQTVFNFYAALLGLESSQVSDLFYKFLVQYEVAVLVLNLVPYVALKIIS